MTIQASIRIFLLVISIGLIFSCENDISEEDVQKTTIEYDEEIAFTWSLDSLNARDEFCVLTHKITNNGSNPLGTNWSIYFNQLQTGIDLNSVSEGVKMRRVFGTFFEVMPSETFTSLAPGESFSYSFRLNGWILRESDGPNGIYSTRDNENARLIRDVTVVGLDESTMGALPLENPLSRFEDNFKYTTQDLDVLASIMPTPKMVDRSQSGNFKVTGDLTYTASSGLEKEIEWMKYIFNQFYTGSITSSEDGDITLEFIDSPTSVNGEYALDVKSDGITISAASKEGILNGISSLAQMIHPDDYASPDNEIEFPLTRIEDLPGYQYRGIMLDVSRNFHHVDDVKRLLDLMAFYKLNKLHFHLTDDEGWRIEIAGLPELTSVGARRGHTLDEKDFLHPSYASGPYPDHSYGSGYYTRAEYIDLLRYAHDRHIEVIPEIDVPGHSRAAIVSMRHRYRKYMAQGDEDKAKQYLLDDPDDASEYSSAQGYGDNAVCVCQESTYDFMEKVIDELVLMHKEADHPLNTIHSGGDEVAYGAWQKSPICQAFIKANTESVSSSDDLPPYFTRRFKAIVDKYGITTGGWEEYTLKFTSDGHEGTQINPDFVGQKLLPYAWNATWGWGREDMAYKLANAGYDVVMCNSPQLYFDMAYNLDPKENGLMWTGLVDTKSPFFLIPENIYNMPIKRNNRGQPVEGDLFSDHTRLTEDGRKNILGIQGLLWSETIYGPDRIYYCLFPKTLGLTERAWNPNPQWAELQSEDQRRQGMEADWGRFAQILGEHQLPILDHLFAGVGYRIPLPGLKEDNGKVMANVRFPGLELRYTVDGSEPQSSSSLYSAPITIGSGVKKVRMKAFDTNGRSSRESVWIADN